MELKKTLLMPKTNFEMRGNLANKEPLIVKSWQEQHLYENVLKSREGNEEYAFHDGPPYANGNIHCGHLLNRVLKDFIVRQKTMLGYYVPFTFGFDTHGLPIENMVIKQGVNRKTTPIVDFRDKCKQYALKQVDHQKEQIRRIGIMGDYDKPYLTLNKEFESHQIEVFSMMALNGLIYKGLKPVYWSPSSESALAEAEIEYQDITSSSIYVAFDVLDGKGVVPTGSKAVIWTTTPWTIPANLAISVHPRFEYGLFDTNKGQLILLLEFIEQLTKELNLENVKLIKTFKGKDIEYVTTKHPLYDRESLIICGEHVTNDSGTGLVHTAPGHGADDYIVCQKYGIKPYCPVDDKGYMMAECGEGIAGLFYEDANKVVLEKLDAVHALLKETPITHSYPHDWRTKKPLIFRATPQWFCSISKIKDNLLQAINEVNFVPSWGKTRMENMIKDRSDWCISRQRAWGVPIPIIYCEDNTPIIEKEVFDHIAKLFKEYGSNIWYLKDAKDLLPEGYKNEHSPNGLFTKEKDIMDVWFDSGSSFNTVLKSGEYDNKKFPCDLYLEGSDQYRGWFNSSLTISVACYGKAPYKNVVSHGWVLDEKWEKMSKSSGNGIDPSKVANTYGADILRLWVSTVDYQQDVRLSDSIIQQISEQYRKIRNTFKFLLGNLSNGDESKFDPNKDMVNEFEVIDTFVLARLEEVINKVNNYFNHYDFASSISTIMTFMSTDLSSLYLDIGKDILYCNDKESLRRKQMQTVIFKVCDALCRLLTPIIPFTMEEVWKNMPNYDGKSPAYLSYPTPSNVYGEEVLKQYKEFLQMRDEVLKALEIARRNNLIGSSQEAKVIIPHYEILKQTGLDNNLSELAKLFIVSEVEINDDATSPNAYKVEGEKCPRCWNFVNKLIRIDDETCVCPRCQKVLVK